MTEAASISSTIDPKRIFQCPACKETIDGSAPRCRFCSAPIDFAAAAVAADEMDRLNLACNDASILRTTALSMIVFFAAMFVPFFGFLGLVGFYVLVFAVPVLAVRWWIRFGVIQSSDPDFTRARRTLLMVSVMASLLLVWVLFRWVMLLFPAFR